jgi:hypothetical protein
MYPMSSSLSTCLPMATSSDKKLFTSWRSIYRQRGDFSWDTYMVMYYTIHGYCIEVHVLFCLTHIWSINLPTYFVLGKENILANKMDCSFSPKRSRWTWHPRSGG